MKLHYTFLKGRRKSGRRMSDMEEISKAVEQLSKSVRDVCVAFGKLGEVFNINFSELQAYQLYELAHPKKKPRGSIRRKRKRRIVYAKDCIEIGKSLYEGMMEGFGMEDGK